MSMSPIALITDFGITDTYVGQMKGVILGINPQAVIVDVTHAIAPQSIFHGALCLDECFDAFPAGTIHVVVVDPGVGSSRRRIAVEIGSQRIVGPDNGLLSLVSKRHPIFRIHELTEPQFHRQPVAPTFHGRDIFAPVAAFWSLGEESSHFGPEVKGPLKDLSIPTITRQLRMIEGVIIAIDHFGNLISNITGQDLPPDCTTLVTEIAGNQFHGLHRFYAERNFGEYLVLLSSGGRLEIAQNGGPAARSLPVTIGTPIKVIW